MVSGWADGLIGGCCARTRVHTGVRLARTHARTHAPNGQEERLGIHGVVADAALLEVRQTRYGVRGELAVRLLLVGEGRDGPGRARGEVVLRVERAGDGAELLLGVLLHGAVVRRPKHALNAVRAEVPPTEVVADLVRELGAEVRLVHAGARVRVEDLARPRGGEAVLGQVRGQGHEQLALVALSALAPAPLIDFGAALHAHAGRVRAPPSQNAAARRAAHGDLHVAVLHHAAVTVKKVLVEVGCKHLLNAVRAPEQGTQIIDGDEPTKKRAGSSSGGGSASSSGRTTPVNNQPIKPRSTPD